ncbi:MAG: hypothetical protein N2423_08725, partial [Novosphingobium sp.]|nr:hypothetical protein [Novosphingobium sp.]
FRLHGRDPATGLDCLGVLSQAMAAIGRPVRLPSGYRLRSHTPSGLDDWAKRCGFEPVSPPSKPGDVMMVCCAPCQPHLLVIVDGDRFVHAHAGLKRVVIEPCPVTWPIIGHWRLMPRREEPRSFGFSHAHAAPGLLKV